MRKIINQDRDCILDFTGNEYFYTAAIIHEGTIMGINLMMSGKALGTFDSVEKAIDEISRILNSKDEIVLVGGYSNGGIAQ